MGGREEVSPARTAATRRGDRWVSVHAASTVWRTFTETEDVGTTGYDRRPAGSVVGKAAAVGCNTPGCDSTNSPRISDWEMRYETFSGVINSRMECS